MTKPPTLLTELRSTPEPLQRQVLDFLLFLKSRFEQPSVVGDKVTRRQTATPPHLGAYI